jgi:hypothetical protein
MPNPLWESALHGSLKPGSNNTIAIDNSCSKPTADESQHLVGVQPNRGVWFAHHEASLGGQLREN